MRCPRCFSTNLGDAAPATYKDAVCKTCNYLFMHEDKPDPANVLRAIEIRLDEIVVSEGEDAGVIKKSSESPTHYDAERNCTVYENAYFSELGEALVKLARFVREMQ